MHPRLKPKFDPPHSHGEAGNRVFLRPARGETCEFFVLDCDEARKQLRVGAVAKLCDLAISAQLVNCPAAALLVELKGSDISRAATQIDATWGFADRHFDTRWKGATKHAIVKLSGRVHGNMKDIKDRFHRKHGVVLDCTRSEDLSQHVRSKRK